MTADSQSQQKLVLVGPVEEIPPEDLDILGHSGYSLLDNAAQGQEALAILSKVVSENKEDPKYLFHDLIQAHRDFPQAEILIVDPPENPLVLRNLINRFPGIHFLKNSRDIHALIRKLESLKISWKLRRNEGELRRLSTQRYKELTQLNENLEKAVEERTLHIQASHSEEKRRLKQERSLIQFLLEMQRTIDLDEVFAQLRRYLKSHNQVFEVFLFQKSSQKNRIRYVFRGNVKVETLEISDLSQGKSSWMAASDQSLLASLISRPLNRILRVPLSPNPEPVEVWLEIVGEGGRALVSDEGLTEFIEGTAEVFRIARLVVDRILSDSSTALASHRWAQIFDGLEDPIAIVSREFKVIRANSNFHRKQDSGRCFERFAGATSPCVGCPLTESKTENPTQIRVGDRFFAVHAQVVGPARFVHYYEDVTESRMLYARLIQTEKLEALGALAGQVAHELNNPLSGIRNLSQVLKSECKSHDDQIYSDLLEVEKATRRCQGIIHQLLEFSKEGEPEARQCSLDEIIQSTIILLKTVMRNHRVHLNLQAPESLLWVEPQLIQQVIFNLVQNACQAMGQAGQLSISTQVDSANSFVEFQIQDTGPGVPEAAKKRLFEAFFTTKPIGKGTGLGLYLSKKILERFGGSLRFDSNAQGTIFFGRLPQRRPQ